MVNLAFQIFSRLRATRTPEAMPILREMSLSQVASLVTTKGTTEIDKLLHLFDFRLPIPWYYIQKNCKQFI